MSSLTSVMNVADVCYIQKPSVDARIRVYGPIELDLLKRFCIIHFQQIKFEQQMILR